MSHSDFRLFMENLSGKYHGDTYHLIAKNCNHFTDEVCLRLTGKPIPGWVNRLAKLGKIREPLFLPVLKSIPYHMFSSKLHPFLGQLNLELAHMISYSTYYFNLSANF